MSKTQQIEMVSLDDLVPKDHTYRKFVELFNFKTIEYRLKKLESKMGRDGYGMERLFKMLLYQFMEDLSDRQLEEAIRSNTICKWFCGMGLTEKTPDHSLFGKIRDKIGTTQLSKLFSIMREQLREAGYMSEVFTFVDSSHLITKASLWEERDVAIKAKYDKLENSIMPKFAKKDKQARLGCKGKDKFWYGYKKHASVDMQSGMINKVAVTPANQTDAKCMKHIAPSQGAVYADKGYCTKDAVRTSRKKGLHHCAIKKNNMKGKNVDQDKWYSSLRSPYERVFSKQSHRARYVGVAKNQFAEFMNAMCFNLKRLVAISPPTLRVL